MRASARPDGPDQENANNPRCCAALPEYPLQLSTACCRSPTKVSEQPPPARRRRGAHNWLHDQPVGPLAAHAALARHPRGGARHQRSFYSTILEAVVDEAGHRGYGVLVTSRLGDDPASGLSDYFHSNRADGMLVFDGFLNTAPPPSPSPARPDPAAGRLPMTNCPTRRSIPVLTDNLEAAGPRCRASLIDFGHRRIGHVGGLSRNALPNERMVGYRKAAGRSR